MLLLTLLLFFQYSSESAILGTWHGTSICVDKKVDTACNDEVVVYDVDTAGVKIKGNVMVHAYRIVNKEKDWMGDLEFSYNATTGTWVSDITVRRGAIRFLFKVDGTALSGTLVELPSMRQIRKMELRKDGKG